MFAGIDVSRPWPKTGMTSQKWLDVPVRAVQLRMLTLTQDGIYLKPLLEPETPVGGDRHPHVVLWKNRYYLEDGHHRVIRSAIEGYPLVFARVLFLG